MKHKLQVTFSFSLRQFPAFNYYSMNTSLKRLGFVGIIIYDREQCSATVNKILSENAHLILSRTGLPNAKDNLSVITLVIDATTDELGILTGKLGSVKGISVKSALAKIKSE